MPAKASLAAPGSPAYMQRPRAIKYTRSSRLNMAGEGWWKESITMRPAPASCSRRGVGVGEGGGVMTTAGQLHAAMCSCPPPLSGARGTDQGRGLAPGGAAQPCTALCWPACLLERAHEVECSVRVEAASGLIQEEERGIDDQLHAYGHPTTTPTPREGWSHFPWSFFPLCAALDALATWLQPPLGPLSVVSRTPLTDGLRVTVPRPPSTPCTRALTSSALRR
jgi:hypothetical protein